MFNELTLGELIAGIILLILGISVGIFLMEVAATLVGGVGC